MIDIIRAKIKDVMQSLPRAGGTKPRSQWNSSGGQDDAGNLADWIRGNDVTPIYVNATIVCERQIGLPSNLFHPFRIFISCNG